MVGPGFASLGRRAEQSSNCGRILPEGKTQKVGLFVFSLKQEEEGRGKKPRPKWETESPHYLPTDFGYLLLFRMALSMRSISDVSLLSTAAILKKISV